MSDTANNAGNKISDEVRETVKALTKQVESAITTIESKEMLGVMQISQIHGFPYKGPTVDVAKMKAAAARGHALTGMPAAETSENARAK